MQDGKASHQGICDSHLLQDPASTACKRVRFCLQVRTALQQLPGGPDEAPRIQVLQTEILQSVESVEELEGKLVPRPVPSQFPALQTDIQRFRDMHAEAGRILDLLGRLQVSGIVTE